MNTRTNYHSYYDNSRRRVPSYHQQPHHRSLSLFLPNKKEDMNLGFVCALAEELVFNPYRLAGTACFDINRNIINVTEADCASENGEWEVISCRGMMSHYEEASNDATGGNVTEVFPSSSFSWEAQCCSTKDDIHKYWWETTKEYREEYSKNIIVIKGVMGIISIIASAIFIWMIRRSHDGLSTTQHRILLGICISDIILSLHFASFGMLMPVEVNYWSWNARGSMATCRLDGFLGDFGAGLGLWYNASLCILSLVIVKYEKSDDYIRTRIEPFLHAVPFVSMAGFYILRLATDRVNPDGSGFCGSPIYNPPHCLDAEELFAIEGLFDKPCGNKTVGSFGLYEMYYVAGIVSPLAIMVTSLTIVYKNVLKIERKMLKYGRSRFSVDDTSYGTGKPSDDTCRPIGICATLRYTILSRICIVCSSICTKRQKEDENNKVKGKRKKLSRGRVILYKGVAYSCSLLLSWTFTVVYFISFHFGKIEEPPFAVVYLLSIFMPLQGVYNLAIYMHPKILAARRSKRNHISWWQAFVKAFWSKGKLKSRKTRGGTKNISFAPNAGIKNKEGKNSGFVNIKNKTPNSGKATKRSLRKKSFRPIESGNEKVPAPPKDVLHLSFGRLPSTMGAHIHHEMSDQADEGYLYPPVAIHRTTLNAESTVENILTRKSEDDHDISHTHNHAYTSCDSDGCEDHNSVLSTSQLDQGISSL